MSDEAIQKANRRDDPAYKTQENKTRLVRDIRNNIIPRESRLAKFNMTMDDVNRIRAEYNKPQIIEPAEGRKAYNTLMLNEAIDFISKQDINPSSQTNYVSQLKQVFKPGDVLKQLREPATLKAILNSSTQTNTKKAHIQAALYLISNYPKLNNKLSKKIVAQYRAEFDRLKKISSAQTIHRTQQSIVSFDEIYKRIIDKYGINSIQHLIIQLYKEMIIRDDLGNVQVITSLRDARNPKTNYLVYRPNPLFILRQYKTSDRYGELRVLLSTEVYYIMKTLKIKANNPLFVNSKGEPYGPLSTYIGNLLDEIEIDRPYGQSINYIRHARISDELRNVKSIEDRVMLSEKALHSPAMSANYIRKL